VHAGRSDLQGHADDDVGSDLRRGPWTCVQAPDKGSVREDHIAVTGPHESASALGRRAYERTTRAESLRADQLYGVTAPRKNGQDDDRPAFSSSTRYWPRMFLGGRGRSKTIGRKSEETTGNVRWRRAVQTCPSIPSKQHQGQRRSRTSMCAARYRSDHTGAVR
jgi:hypothetical protein